jgi:hypothetical protein
MLAARKHVVVACTLAATAAQAETFDAEERQIEARSRVEAGAGLTLADAVPAGNGAVVTSASWDAARRDLVGLVGAEVALAEHVYLVGGANHEALGTWRPYVGAKVAITDDVAGSVVYKSEGFTEPEGEVEARLVAGHRVAGAYVLGNLIYGQDADGKERDVEAVAAVLRTLGSSVVASAETRARFALASTRDLRGPWDVYGDLGAAYPVGRYAARVAAGVSVVGGSRAAVGPLGTVSLATLF